MKCITVNKMFPKHLLFEVKIKYLYLLTLISPFRSRIDIYGSKALPRIDCSLYKYYINNKSYSKFIKYILSSPEQLLQAV